jgi:hypothetical protein
MTPEKKVKNAVVNTLKTIQELVLLLPSDGWVWCGGYTRHCWCCYRVVIS